MNLKKYEDMVYLNSRGHKIIDMLTQPDIWSHWVSKLHLRGKIDESCDSYEEYAHRVFIEALWHFGYAKDSGSCYEMKRTTSRLRGGKSIQGSVDLRVNGIPWEFFEFDDFLEHYVLPLI